MHIRLLMLGVGWHLNIQFKGAIALLAIAFVLILINYWIDREASVKTTLFGGTPKRGKGPAFEASYGGQCANDACLDGEYDEGDQIRADGLGGWECAVHKEDEDADGA